MGEKEKKQEEIELPVLCATCAWREFCVKQYHFDNTTPIKCPDYSPDPKLLKKKRDLENVKAKD